MSNLVAKKNLRLYWTVELFNNINTDDPTYSPTYQIACTVANFRTVGTFYWSLGAASAYYYTYFVMVLEKDVTAQNGRYVAPPLVSSTLTAATGLADAETAVMFRMGMCRYDYAVHSHNEDHVDMRSSSRRKCNNARVVIKLTGQADDQIGLYGIVSWDVIY
jgi:hypothetical protein